jgi:hypothetical protein
MNGIREWTTVICLAALVAAMLQSLVPNGSMERMAKFVIGAFVICALISPLSRIIPKIGLSLRGTDTVSESTRLQSTVEQQVRTATQESITNLVAAELSGIQMKCKNVTVDMDTNDDGSISITKVIVVLDKENAADCQRAAAYLEKELGLKMEVTADVG